METHLLPVRRSSFALARLTARALFFLVALLISPLAAGLTPAAAEDVSFGGAWATQTDKGWHYDMVLKQRGSHVTGSYVAAEDGSKGKISGTVTDNVLSFKWQQSGFTGDGQFALSDDGSKFVGVYNADDDPKLTAEFQHGKWNGTRKGGGGAEATGTAASFAGILGVKSDKGWDYAFVIVQKGADVTGTYVAIDPTGSLKDEGSIVGKVIGQTLKFRWEQGEFTGRGQLTLKADKSVTGTYTADPNPKLPPEFLSGTYSSGPGALKSK